MFNFLRPKQSDKGLDTATSGPAESFPRVEEVQEREVEQGKDTAGKEEMGDRSAILFMEVLVAFAAVGLILFGVDHFLVDITSTRAGEQGIWNLELTAVGVVVTAIVLEHMIRLVTMFVPRLQKDVGAVVEEYSVAKNLFFVVGSSVALYLIASALMRVIAKI